MAKELTNQQEAFCQAVAKGNTLTEAYLTSYPKSKQWQKEAVWVQASILHSKDKIQNRIDELRADTQEDITWTRKRVLANLNYILFKNKENITRREQIYNEMLDEKYKEFTEYINTGNTDKRTIDKMKNEIYQLQLQEHERINTREILNIIKVINRMQGYDITKVEIQEEDEERQAMESLTVEELRALAGAIIESEREKQKA